MIFQFKVQNGLFVLPLVWSVLRKRFIFIHLTVRFWLVKEHVYIYKSITKLHSVKNITSVFHKNKKKTICIASFLLPFPPHRINQYGYIKQNKLKPHNTQLIETKLQKILWGISESKVLYKGKLTRNIRDQSNASHLPISARWQSACCELRRRSEGVVARTNAPLAREYWNVRSLTQRNRAHSNRALWRPLKWKRQTVSLVHRSGPMRQTLLQEHGMLWREFAQKPGFLY